MINFGKWFFVVLYKKSDNDFIKMISEMDNMSSDHLWSEKYLQRKKTLHDLFRKEFFLFIKMISGMDKMSSDDLLSKV